MPQHPTAKTARKRILVVDDNPSDTQLVKQYLEQTDDYLVLEINVASTALAAAVAFKPHLILLDLLMPGMDGGTIAAGLRVNAELQAVPIVFLTALVTKQEIAAGGGRGGQIPFLAKPIILPELRACLRHHLGG